MEVRALQVEQYQYTIEVPARAVNWEDARLAHFYADRAEFFVMQDSAALPFIERSLIQGGAWGRDWLVSGDLARACHAVAAAMQLQRGGITLSARDRAICDLLSASDEPVRGHRLPLGRP